MVVHLKKWLRVHQPGACGEAAEVHGWKPELLDQPGAEGIVAARRDEHLAPVQQFAQRRCPVQSNPPESNRCEPVKDSFGLPSGDETLARLAVMRG